MLLTALTQFQTLTVSQAQRRERPLASVLRPAKSNAYAIDMKYYGDGDDRSIWWQIVDTRLATFSNPGLKASTPSGRTALAVRDELVALNCAPLRSNTGVINNIDARMQPLRARSATRASFGPSTSWMTVKTSGIAHARSAAWSEQLRQTDMMLMPPQLCRRCWRQGRQRLPMMLKSVVHELAGRADLPLAPLSDRAHIALMLSQFYSGRIDAAIAAGNRALALNPGSPDAAAKLGLVLFSSGYFDAGVSLARDAGRSVDVVPSDAVLVLALDAYRRKDWSEASLLSEQVSHSTFLIGVLRVAALGQLGSDEAVPRLAELRQLAPDFETTFREENGAATLSAGTFRGHRRRADESGCPLQDRGFGDRPFSVVGSSMAIAEPVTHTMIMACDTGAWRLAFAHWPLDRCCSFSRSHQAQHRCDREARSLSWRHLAVGTPWGEMLREHRRDNSGNERVKTFATRNG